VKRYRFRLDAVLRARRAQEDAARQELARANHALRQAQALAAAELARLRALPVPTGVVDLVRDAEDRVWRTLAADSAHFAGRQAEELAVAAAVSQAAWREAAQRVAALERLDERRRAEHAALVAHAEAAEVDDIVTARFDPMATEVG
jgi:flagellar biosynthesis chaperone FliJ